MANNDAISQLDVEIAKLIPGAKPMPSHSHTARDRLIRQFDLRPHPEGGFYRETYRATEQVARQPSSALRSASTAIYYLLSDDAYSAWHRIGSDELWHFYAGDPLDVHTMRALGSRPRDRPEGAADDVTSHRLGDALANSKAVFQACVSAGDWFAAERVPGPHGFSLVGCTVAPGFAFSEFELADVGTLDALENAHPRHQALIRRLRAKR